MINRNTEPVKILC